LKIKFYDVSFINNLIPYPDKESLHYHLGISMYSRLFISKILDDDINKLIYLDADTVVNGTLVDLINIDVDDFYVGGVLDFSGDNNKKNIGMDKNHIYINSGVLLINLDKWRKNNVENYFIEFIRSSKNKKFINDQNAINKIFENKILDIDLKYNAMPNIFFTNYKIFNSHIKSMNDSLKTPITIENYNSAVKNPAHV